MIRLAHIIPQPLADNGIEPDSAIYNTDVCFEKGQNYLVTAPSGKGKSTFLHIIYGLRHDHQGTAYLDDQPLTQLSLEAWTALRRTRLSMVFQDLRLFGPLTAWENLVLKQELSQVPALPVLRTWAERLGMVPFLDQPCETLSYGQRQRVALLRALAQPFDYLLLDEPFSHLDKANIDKATALITEVCAERGAGLILVSLGDPYGFTYAAHKRI